MADFLDIYTRALGSNGVEAVNRVLARVKGQQIDVDNLLSILGSRNEIASLSVPPYEINTRVQASNANSAFRDSNRSLRNLFRDSLDIDALLETTEVVLGSEIKGLEDEIHTLEKMLDTFAFYLADGKKFNGFFIETFNDSINVNKDLKFNFSDRDGILLTKDHYASIDSNEGVAKIGERASYTTHPLQLSSTKINHFPVTSLNKGVSGSDKSVLALIDAKMPVANDVLSEFIDLGVDENYPTETLDVTSKGLLMDLVYSLASPSYSEVIKLQPLSNKVVEVTQIYIYEDDDSEKKKPLLEEPFLLGSPRSISFEGQMVSRIELLLRQPEYKRRAFGLRNKTVSDDRLSAVADRYKNVYMEGQISIKNPVVRKPESWFAQDAYGRIRDSDRSTISRILTSTRDRSRHSLTSNTNRELIPMLKDAKTSGVSIEKGAGRKTGGGYRVSTVRDMVYDKGAGSLKKSDARQIFKNLPFSITYKAPAVPRDLAEEKDLVPINEIKFEDVFGGRGFRYVYEIGIGDIEVGMGPKNTKAVYVSKPIVMDGDPGVVRLSVVENHATSMDINRDSRQISSTEYSVSNSSYPENEENWIPILPDNQKEIKGERIFLDSSGLGLFRFTASTDEEVYVYNNGILYDEDISSLLVHSAADQGYVGVRFHPRAFGPEDFLTVDYTPLERFSQVDFSLDPEFGNLPLAYPKNSGGKGEYIEYSEGRKEYALEFLPYVSKDLVRDAVYNTSSGLSYKPITIVFDDGSGAINLTNYKKGEQSSLNADAATYQFLHSDGVIVFNKPPVNNFTVVYQYIPARLRVRAVLRCNSPTFTTSSVDLIQLKAKTRKSGIQRL